MFKTDKEHNSETIPLSRLGWNTYFQTHIEAYPDPSLSPARVVGVHRNHFLIHQGKGEILATAAGKLGHKTKGLFPVIGDWVLSKDKVISHVLPRKNTLSRGSAGSRGKQEAQPLKEQVIAANLDSVFIVCGMDRDFNIRRIERYLTLVYNCGLTPVIILTKADLHPHPQSLALEMENLAFGVPVHLISAKENTCLSSLEPYISSGRTIAMVGSSGAGKSTLVNRLYGEEVQVTSQVSETLGKGRHTTTNRSLILMPQGGMVIDNPGIREIGMWENKEGLGAVFPEIEKMARGCRFSDCSHTHEPGCSVIQALATGELSPERMESFKKMRKELDYLSLRQDKTADRLEKERWKGIALKIKSMKKRGHTG